MAYDIMHDTTILEEKIIESDSVIFKKKLKISNHLKG